MKLVLSIFDDATISDIILFEYWDKFAAIYDIYCITEEYLSKVTKNITHKELTEVYWDYAYGKQTFTFHGISLYYRDFITTEYVARNLLVEDCTYRLKSIEANIVTLEEYFDRFKQGYDCPPLRSALKYYYPT